MIKEKEVYAVIAKRIREERKRLNLTQEELAEKAGIHYKFLNRIERNVSRPSLEMIIKFSNVFDVPFLSLFIENKDKAQLKNFKDKIEYLFPELSKEKQTHLINALKEFKKVIA